MIASVCFCFALLSLLFLSSSLGTQYVGKQAVASSVVWADFGRSRAVINCALAAVPTFGSSWGRALTPGTSPKPNFSVLLVLVGWLATVILSGGFHDRGQRRVKPNMSIGLVHHKLSLRYFTKHGVTTVIVLITRLELARSVLRQTIFTRRLASQLPPLSFILHYGICLTLLFWCLDLFIVQLIWYSKTKIGNTKNLCITPFLCWLPCPLGGIPWISNPNQTSHTLSSSK